MRKGNGKKAAFHTLGCKVNQYETAGMTEMFRSRGYDIVGEHEFADVYVINTCTVTAMADRKSRQYIRRMKKLNPRAIVAVTGCYVQISPDDVEAIEGVDIIAGMDEKHRIVELVEGTQAGKSPEKDDFVEMGPVTSAENRTRAYIKIQEGCNRFCSYCIIPYARGRLRSRPPENIVEEAAALIDAGYRELVLTGINTALYGMEKDPDNFGLEPVVAAVNELEGDFRIRLSSLEPAVVNGEYVKRLFQYDRLCHHLHMSAQSGSDTVLERMNRPYGRDGYMELVNALRQFDPNYGISTDIIVGFPGETHGDFRDSCRLIEESRFCRTHVFKYSKRPGTAAADMDGQIDSKIKNERSEELIKLAESTSEDFFRVNINTVRRVLTEEMSPDGKYFIGYSDNYIKTYIPFDDKIKLNSFVSVRLMSLMRDGMEGKADEM
ncbi:MAG: tRNA (N(6)-L-threonylcarbamoyladenosine(37)-C(2))-methylthiotransferase MtaB [Bacillota bacterium]|nr:tRNA (N(6)-L-threonylcarbamoyladenosine(37)-C(2))-methylthiotransferase MtaB [Bacillota bacterium]